MAVRCFLIVSSRLFFLLVGSTSGVSLAYMVSNLLRIKRLVCCCYCCCWQYGAAAAAVVANLATILIGLLKIPQGSGGNNLGDSNPSFKAGME
jgi:hypothetical protein